MKKILTRLCERCKAVIEDAAYGSYDDNPDGFDGCHAMLDLDNNAQIEITCDRHGSHEAVAYHENMHPTPLLEKHLEEYLDAHADEQAQWQDAYDSDDWRGVDPGCDPAFPHYGDFELWAYGR